MLDGLETPCPLSEPPPCVLQPQSSPDPLLLDALSCDTSMLLGAYLRLIPTVLPGRQGPARCFTSLGNRFGEPGDFHGHTGSGSRVDSLPKVVTPGLAALVSYHA